MEQRGLQRSCPALGLLEERFEICAAVQPRRLRHQCSLSHARIPRGAQPLNGGVGLMQIFRCVALAAALALLPGAAFSQGDRKSTRLNSSHQIISYAVFCLKKKTAP